MKSPSASDVKSSFPQLDSAQATGSDADVRTDSVAKSLTFGDEVGISPMAMDILYQIDLHSHLY